MENHFGRLLTMHNVVFDIRVFVSWLLFANDNQNNDVVLNEEDVCDSATTEWISTLWFNKHKKKKKKKKNEKYMWLYIPHLYYYDYYYYYYYRKRMQ